jgi:hypothetical protein
MLRRPVLLSAQLAERRLGLGLAVAIRRHQDLQHAGTIPICRTYSSLQMGKIVSQGHAFISTGGL